MTNPTRFSSKTKFKPGFGYLSFCGKQKWEFLNISEIIDGEVSDLSRAIRFSNGTREIAKATPAACNKAIEVINAALAEYSG